MERVEGFLALDNVSSPVVSERSLFNRGGENSPNHQTICKTHVLSFK